MRGACRAQRRRGGGISGIDESSAPGSHGQEGAGPQRAGSGQTSGAVSGSARVCVYTTCVCVSVHAHLQTWWPATLLLPGLIGRLFADLASMLQKVGGAQEQGQTYSGMCSDSAFQSLAGRTRGLLLPRDLRPLCGSLCFIPYLHYSPALSLLRGLQNCLRTLSNTKVSSFSENFV